MREWGVYLQAVYQSCLPSSLFQILILGPLHRCVSYLVKQIFKSPQVLIPLGLAETVRNSYPLTFMLLHKRDRLRGSGP